MMPLTLGAAIGIAIALWFTQGWYLNVKLRKLHEELERVHDQFYGLREYLYEIDPQFDEERRLLSDLHSDEPGTMFAGMEHLELTKQKNTDGYRTLNSLFLDGGFRAPNR